MRFLAFLAVQTHNLMTQVCYWFGIGFVLYSQFIVFSSDLPEDHCLRLRAASKEVVLSRYYNFFFIFVKLFSYSPVTFSNLLNDQIIITKDVLKVAQTSVLLS